MKNKLVLLVSIFCLICNDYAYAYDCVVDGIYYTRISNNELEVTFANNNYNSYSGDIIIPSHVSYGGKQYQVTSIGKNAFYICTSLHTVYLPNTINCIGSGAFAGCSSLYNVNIPNGVTIIDYSTFSDCSALKNIIIPESVTEIKSGYTCAAFSGCTSLESIKIPNTITSIGRYTFQGCTSLNKIILSNAITIIGEYTFDGCSKLSSITIPENVTEIETGAFSGCSSLETIVIPNNVTYIWYYAFDNCTLLKKIVLGSAIKTINYHAFRGCDAITSIYSLNPSPPKLNNNANKNNQKSFESNCYTWTDVYVPSGSLSTYKSNSSWKEFVSLSEFDPSVLDNEITPDGNCDITDTDISVLSDVVYISNVEASVGTQLTLSVKMKNSVTAEGFGFDLYLPDGVTVATDEDGFPMVELSTERTTARKTNSFDAAFQSDGSLRVLAASTNGSAISGNDGEVCLITINIANDMVEGDYPILIKNIAISDVDAVSHRTEQVKSTLTISAYTPGDANNDGVIDVSDFTATAHYLLGNAPTGFNVKAADANGDGVVDVADLTAVAHIILYGSVNRPSSAPILNSINPQ